MGKLKDLLGVTSYLWYGGGATHGSIESVKNFKLQRFFVDNFAVTRGINVLQTEPTWQNFRYDTYLQTLKNAGITTIWATQGIFDWQSANGGSTRKTCIPYPLDPSQPSTWFDLAWLCKQIAERYKTNGLVDYIEIQNEWDFKWSLWRILTPEEYAVLFKECYTAIRSVSPTQKILMGGGISPSLDVINRFLNKLSQLYNGNPPKDFYLNLHWYMRDKSTDQTGGETGITPEDAKAYEHGLQLDNLCQTQGYLGWFCTETGWATDDSKQKAPDLEGFTREEAQGVLMTRLALIWGATKYCKGITFWHCRDLYDAPPYAYGGVNRKDWSAKPSNTICSNFLAQYGEKEPTDFAYTFNQTTQEGLYFVEIEPDKDLIWTNKNNYGEYTPMPKLEITTEPTKPSVEINITGDTNKINIQIT